MADGGAKEREGCAGVEEAMSVQRLNTPQGRRYEFTSDLLDSNTVTFSGTCGTCHRRRTIPPPK